MALNKKNRLKKKLDFEDVFKKGRAIKGAFLFIKYKKNKLGVSRFGFIVSAKVAKKAFERNKIRRTISEMARHIIDSLDSYDIVVFATHKIITEDKEDVSRDFLNVLKKIQ